MDWRDDPVGSAHRGENPMVIARMRSGFAVIGDTQHLPGYSLLLCARPVRRPPHRPPARPAPARSCSTWRCSARRSSAPAIPRRINYEVLGNSLPLAARRTSMPRYEWEPAELSGGPVWRYPDAVRASRAPLQRTREHGELRATIRSELERVMRSAY